MSPPHRLRFYQIDAFTAEPFGGNPAAVVLLPSTALPLPDATRQKIASEMNLSETAFLECEGDDFRAATRFALRWFTPACEVPLCGHATLAAAAAIFFGEGNPARQLAFDTLSGQLLVTRQAAAGGSQGGGQGGSEGGSAAGGEMLCMDLPLVEASAAAVPAGMEAGSPLVKAAVGELPVAEVFYAPQLRYLLVALRSSDEEAEASRRAFLALQPNSQQLGEAHTGGQLVGIIVTLQGDGRRHDILSRFFAPWAGIAEDPVTGSAHAVLGPYWARRLGKQQLRARQSSPRGGELLVDVRAAEGRVTVAGQAATVLEGSLLLPASK